MNDSGGGSRGVGQRASSVALFGVLSGLHELATFTTACEEWGLEGTENNCLLH